jgi:chromosome segregation ATPase
MEEIRKVISEIEQKIAKMRGSMDNITTKNQSLKSEIELLAEKLKLREVEAREFKTKYDELSQRNEQVNLSFKEDKEHNTQIDALVREIDDCIGRLKE